MTNKYDAELMQDRARDLLARGKNGIERVFVSLNTTARPAYALLEVEFINYRYVAGMAERVNVDHVPPTQVFPISGGVRIPAGDQPGQVRVVEVTPIVDRSLRTPGRRAIEHGMRPQPRLSSERRGPERPVRIVGPTETYRLRLKVQPIGDYSTYTLHVIYEDAVLDGGGNPVLDDQGHPVLESKIDPLFASIDFKFRPGCFNSNCRRPATYEKPDDEPVIDYLARDFDSFKHTLITAMMERVPGWKPTSEADLDQVLIDLIAADADELADYQDRVMNEAYFGRARKRVSLARHARLMDYHIHQGNQATTVIALKTGSDVAVPRGFGVLGTKKWQDPGAVIFTSAHDRDCYEDLNQLSPYRWGEVVTALEAGSTEADIVPPAGDTKTDADALRDLLRQTGTAPGALNELKENGVLALVIVERLNPATGTPNGVDRTARQLLHLLEGEAAAESVHDPVEDRWVVRVHWRTEDRLQRRYALTTDGPLIPATGDVTCFHGNLVRVTHGRPHRTDFYPPGAALGHADDSQFERSDAAHYEYPPKSRWGVLCPLPNAPLAYRNTPPGGEIAPVTTLAVAVSGIDNPWAERIDFIESESDDAHFVVETDEYGRSTVRFGNNVNGRGLPEGAVVTCRYQVGGGTAGNVGADTLVSFDGSPSGYPEIEEVWQPFDVTDGREPEPPAEIIRNAPQAYRARQLRAVTLADYAKRAEGLPDVSHAHAEYGWTGSWRTVRLAIDPKGTTELTRQVRERLAGHLNAVRLIGEDIEIRRARYAPLDIFLQVCAHPDYWAEDLEGELETEFSTGYTADGRMGFFHPDAWTFGQSLHVSQLIGRAMTVKGIDRVLLVTMRRWHPGNLAGARVISVRPEDLPVSKVLTLAVAPDEIIRVENDPSRLENGRIQFEIIGGRR